LSKRFSETTAVITGAEIGSNLLLQDRSRGCRTNAIHMISYVAKNQNKDKKQNGTLLPLFVISDLDTISKMFRDIT